jgi:KaiC/GvpD/RAD55 family RecA-like ATPase
MRAQADLVRSLAEEAATPGHRHALLNRHFAWLTQAYPTGKNRHLFSVIEGLNPLRTKPLRNPAGLSEEIRGLLRTGQPLSLRHDHRNPQDEKLIQTGPTRISQLVASSLLGVAERRGNFIYLRSPLSILCDYLTDPTMPGSRAYSLLTARNYLFESFGIFPDNLAHDSKMRMFTVPHIETALSHIATSFNRRHQASGWDPITAEALTPAGGLLRHYLATRNVLWMRFKDPDECARYLESGKLRPKRAPFDFVRPDHLDRLPELAELINELWGLPIPIRGADVVFRGGLKFASRQGLVVGLRGGAGTGKTSLALALGASLAPFGTNTLFVTGEESSEDLHAKAQLLIPDQLRRLSFFPHGTHDWLEIQHLSASEFERDDMLPALEAKLDALATALETSIEADTQSGPPKPCRAVVVLDGIHDLFLASQSKSDRAGTADLISRLRKFVATCRELRALVVLTAGQEWAGNQAFDYLVDVAIDLTHEAVDQHGRKPDRRLVLSKARYQFCSVGSHGIQISGSKGVRISPQINYQLDRRAIWRTRIPDMQISKRVMNHAWAIHDDRILATSDDPGRTLPPDAFRPSDVGVKLFRGSSIFLNGEGSSGKAALALKIALSPSYDSTGKLLHTNERVLVVSFLYPKDYYDNIKDVLVGLRRLEYPEIDPDDTPVLEVIQLYPGNYRADQLFNRIEWELEAAELYGAPYTAILIDGLHNVFLQFPEIESYTLFWPQLYSSLRSRPITIISTHTTFVLQGASEGESYRLDDRRTEPLRHSLVQKTDFRFEIDPVPAVPDVVGIRRAEAGSSADIFEIKTIAAINQPHPAGSLLWSRDRLILFEMAQGQLPFFKRTKGR